MRNLSVLFLLFAALACGSSTAPGKAGDPSLLITNNLDASYVYITWQDGNAIVGKDSIPPRTANQCVRFLAQPDSAQWIITATENGATASQGGNFFNPADQPAWTVVVSSAGSTPGSGSPSIITHVIDPALAC
jgi:hypothetical protein